MAKNVRRVENGYVSRLVIMLHEQRRLQSPDAGIRRKAGRTGTLRNHDGRAARALGCNHGHDHRCHGAGRPARRLLPEPALAGQAGNGYPDHHEELDRRERVDPERDGRAEKEFLSDEWYLLATGSRLYSQEDVHASEENSADSCSYSVVLGDGSRVRANRAIDRTCNLNYPGAGSGTQAVRSHAR